MAEKYYGWLGADGYDAVIKIKDYSEAYVYSKNSKGRRDDEFLKAAWDPGSDFEPISEEEAKAIIKKISE